jgi:hypothetical protein
MLTGTGSFRVARPSVWVIACLAWALSPWVRASVTVSVDDLCSQKHLSANDFTANAIVPAAGADGCTVRWTSPTNPMSDRTAIRLYYGQPGQVVQLASEPIQFAPDAQSGFSATRRFTRDELGLHSFITVLVTSTSEILQWTAWTVRATAFPPEPPPSANQSLDIRLGALHLDTARGPFPPSSQADGVVWQAVGEEAVGYELDGDDTGSPAIHVSVSDSWTPTDVGASSIKEALAQRIQKVVEIRNHEVHFNDMQWTETEPEVIRYEGTTNAFERRHYYTIVTVWTDARARAIGNGDAKRFAHETSAGTWSAEDVTEWASYVRGEYTADPQLLKLVKDYTRAGKAIPGFNHFPDMRGGDGGDSTFSLRLIARLRPWAKNGDGPDDDPRFKAGIESFSVVGSRTGLGTAELVQSAEDKGVLCNAFKLFCGDSKVASAELPKGWYRTDSSAQLTNAIGNIAIVQSPPQVAQFYGSRGDQTLQELENVLLAQYRGVMKGAVQLRSSGGTVVLYDEGGHELQIGSNVGVLKLSDLPAKAYFVLGARLRAGALVRKEGIFFPSYRMIPVNAYAQYVVRTSVIKDASSVLTGAPTREVQDPAKLGKNQTIQPPPGWFGSLLSWFGGLPILLRILLIAVPVLVLMWLIAPLRPILVALGKLLGALIQLVAAPLLKAAQRLKG